ncbi:hypothetical protein MAR_036486 [Mya arenaria]|uniref:RecQ-mediated genome instability protein 2 n=1 Tax=Mya arenaria TaxID=6604 RepID=A0ABY7FPH2_MYAAR|nr:uncharacterized protein LOC128212953 [Mya arenaria]XP_052774324.1 uncharacterized protein LOC128212953 [Mya arenaria]XP_052774647.1 uncharacterized protein LOC128213146 [Mya arenaria]XP_052774648.1 uncharacterized protein LOC128213146 [Mya arenaria]WAR22774.1 hypothetical protein MAR_036443 [Mya arenaria]WAR22817.1 hypothetical protein MAR_036486 [Mya arenaria]
MSTTLDRPARKLFLSHLLSCRQCAQSSKTTVQSQDPSVSKIWTAECEERSVEFSMLSVQGVVIETRDNGDSILIDDTTAVALVKGCSKIPFHASTPAKGQYLMIIGQLVRPGSIPMIRPVKIQNLSHNLALTAMWPLEVMDGLNQDSSAAGC